MKNSKFLSVSWKDIFHGFITAFLTATLAGVYEILDAGNLPTLMQIKTHALIGLAAGLGYLLKKIFSNSDGKILIKEAKNQMKYHESKF